MGNVTIEFYGSEYGIGFPLSYIIPYDGRYTRVFSYDTQGYAYERVSVSELVAETNRYYSWGMVDGISFYGFTISGSNLRNQFVHGIWME
jgi:hypothetical protein